MRFKDNSLSFTSKRRVNPSKLLVIKGGMEKGDRINILLYNIKAE